jgi:protein phosphatase
MLPKVFAGKTDKGRKRSNNEDTFVIRAEAGFCLAADGMGGAAAGELASRMFAETAVEVFGETVNGSEAEAVARVQQTFGLANARILAHVAENPKHEGMGCTAELLAFHAQGFVLGHLGDSRCYRWRQGHMHQLTEDHTLVQQQVDEGLISVERVKSHPLRNVILRAVGLKEELALDVLRGSTLAGDLFLLCSDGLTDMLPDAKIAAILQTEGDLNSKADALIEAANAAGGGDNITAVLVGIG